MNNVNDEVIIIISNILIKSRKNRKRHFLLNINI